MLLITLVLSFCLVFQSGTFWTAYKIDTIENRPTAKKMLMWSIGTGVFGLYMMISIIGRAANL